MTMSKYAKFSDEFLKKFESLKDQLLNILLEIENYKTAEEEYRRTLRTLKSVEMEKIRDLSPVVNQCCSFLPYNNVLYSYILYGLVPSLLSEKVYIRPAFLSFPTALKIHTLIEPFFKDQVIMRNWSRREFINSILLQSEVILFTGKYDSTFEIKEYLDPKQLFIYNGNGLISFIVHSDANINEAVKGAIFDRIYNSGQDCICPDIFLIHQSILEEFLKALILSLKNLQFGENKNKQADYSPILKKEVIREVNLFLKKKLNNIIWGRKVDISRMVINPTIVLENNLLNYDYFEFYSPVFRIYTYATINELSNFFNLPFQSEYKMGVSLFGGKEIRKFLEDNQFVVAYNQTYFGIEHGNKPFGGYGRRASYLQIHNKIEIHPILVSAEIERFFSRDKS